MPRRRDEDYDDDSEDKADEEYDPPRRRRRPPEGDATGGLIPHKNAKALTAYYLGVFSLIPCLGIILGPIAIILGFLGLGYAKKHPEAKGQAHAIVGIVLGGLVLAGHVALVALGLVGGFAK